jgi:glucokinase
VRAIGIDVGGTKTAIGVVDVDRGIVEDQLTLETPPPDETGAAFLELLRHTAERMGASLPIGLGVCELVSTEGEIVTQGRINWTTRAVRMAFSSAPALGIEADVRAAAIAEGRFGQGRGIGHWIYANAGTGIATVLMQGDLPYRGARGLGMAFGMSPANLLVQSVDAGAGPVQTIEAHAGAAGMMALARRSGFEGDQFRDLLDAAHPQADLAANICREGGAVLGRALAGLANMLDPQRIVLGGGVAIASALYRDACAAAFQATLWHKPSPFITFTQALLGANAGLVGAAMVAKAST